MAYQYFQEFKKGTFKDGESHKGFLDKLLRHLAHFDCQDKPRVIDCSAELKGGLDSISRAFSKHINKLLVKVVPSGKSIDSEADFIVEPLKLNTPKFLFSLDSRVCVANRGLSLNQTKPGNALVISSNGRLKNFQLNTKLQSPEISSFLDDKLSISEFQTVFEKRFELVNTGYNIASFSPNGENIVVCGYENAPIRIVKSEDGSEASSFLIRYEKISSVIWTSNTSLAFAIEGGVLVNHDIDPAGSLTENPPPAKKTHISTLGHDICHMVLVKKEEPTLICANTSGTLFSCDFTNGTVPWKKKVHTRNVSYVSRGANNLLASGGIDNHVVVMDEVTQNEKFRKIMGNTIIGVEWTPDSNFLIVGTREELCIIDVSHAGQIISSLFQSAFASPYHLQSFVVDWSIHAVILGTRESDETGKLWKVGLWELS